MRSLVSAFIPVVYRVITSEISVLLLYYLKSVFTFEICVFSDDVSVFTPVVSVYTSVVVFTPVVSSSLL